MAKFIFQGNAADMPNLPIALVSFLYGHECEIDEDKNDFENDDIQSDDMGHPYIIPELFYNITFLEEQYQVELYNVQGSMIQRLEEET